MFVKHIKPNLNIEVLTHDLKTHGLSKNIMCQILPNSFVWLPDAGTNDVEQCKVLVDKGCKILITDHHIIEKPNPYAVVINNQRFEWINHDGSGACVTYKFIEYCCKKYNINYDYSKHMDMVACANIGDVMSVKTYENRAFNHFGLNNITNPFLLRLCSEFVKGDNVTPMNISWDIIPKINAVIRSDNKELKHKMFEAFVGEYDGAWGVLIKAMKDCHRKQSDISKQIAEEAMEDGIMGKNSIICFVEPSNYNGLAANKVMSSCDKVTIMVHKSGNKYVGSLRSPVPIRDELVKSRLFEFVSGHDSAAGLAFVDNNGENLNKIQHYLDKLDLSQCSEYKVISTIKPSELSEKLCNLSHNYKEIWDNDLPQPTVHCKIRCKGSDWVEMKGATIKYVDGGVSCIKFFTSNKQKEALHIGEDKEYVYDIIAKPDWNIWNGNKYKQLLIEKIEVSGANEITFDDLW
ncbi:MAG: hypothetical protein KBT27_08435 [Prevotellaceae bacterium]|nr:hypothetical protein [Candidatus Faecinaster equi]